MKISFHGASRGVTGSCYLVECADVRVLVDCGLFQGGHEIEEENAKEFGFDAASIDFVLLTHAHLDHCGRLPLLVKRGFKGEIITTAAARELARLVLLDSARLQEEEAIRRERRNARHGGHHPQGLLYSTLDALNSLEYFGRSAKYRQTVTLAPGIDATFYDAGHILGASCISLHLTEHGVGRRILFSGDIGNSGSLLLDADNDVPASDVVVMETTYGDREHRPTAQSVMEFYEAINATFNAGGNVIIPTFALERAQELLFCLREGREKKHLPGSLQVFLDSPMAISATEIFERHPECYGEKLRHFLAHHGDVSYNRDTGHTRDTGHPRDTGHQKRDPFRLPGLHFCRDTADSIALNRISGGAIILAGSGMCSGGRVRHHLRHNLWRRESSIIFVGFAARETLARQIIDGAKTVHIFGEAIPVKARIHTINGFSAHAGQSELLAWHHRTGKPKKTFLVHGEETAMKTFASLLRNTETIMPTLNSTFNL